MSLGKISDGKYLKRVFALIKACYTIRKNVVYQGKVLFYAMSLDCMLIARLCGLREGFYEVGDLRNAEGFSKLFTYLEKILLKRCHGLFLTSRFFYDSFYKSRAVLPIEKVYIVDNKLALSFRGQRPPCRSWIKKKRITIGLFGLLRYERPIKMLIEFAKRHSDRFIVECFGDGSLKNYVQENVCENIRYSGSYKNPDDLSRIYAKVDLNFVVYDANSRNVRLAIPNKLYESAFFGVPILCCAGTSLETIVNKWKIGKVVRIESFDEFDINMSDIEWTWLAECALNCFAITEDELIDDGDNTIRLALNYAG